MEAPETPNRMHYDRVLFLKGNPLLRSLCLWAIFREEHRRDLHYFQIHILKVPTKHHPRKLWLEDQGNFDGPLGWEGHIVHPSQYCHEPKTYHEDDEEEISPQIGKGLKYCARNN
ncbi:hypothetical protein G7Y89_g10755 [Cudoniella acicularis]|uniref:Uncharacterized protein n=1 Tax=Cudoniella acicularis TaxID=354080 RepID=A0A8H4VYG7_9HELO|nr:hypothetical protein G7Y89_g10755 [Cudoniella acicularis]